MPVRSLNSSVLRWVPEEEEVIKAFKDWAKKVCLKRRDVVKIGFFGSYARGDWGVGSDLDVIVVLKESDLPFWKRCIEFALSKNTFRFLLNLVSSSSTYISILMFIPLQPS